MFTRSRRQITITIAIDTIFIFATALTFFIATDPAAIAAGATNLTTAIKYLYYRTNETILIINVLAIATSACFAESRADSFYFYPLDA